MYPRKSVGHGDEQWLQLETQIESGKVSDNCAGFELVWLEMGLIDVGHTEAYEVRGHISFIHAVICDGKAIGLGGESLIGSLLWAQMHRRRRESRIGCP